jgi:hypothetical protein
MTTWIYDEKPDTIRPVLALVEGRHGGSNKKRHTIIRAQYAEGWYELVTYHGVSRGFFAVDDPVICWCEMPRKP